MRSPEYRKRMEQEVLEKSFECYCDKGLRDTGIKELAKYCGMTSANLYSYYDSVDEIIVKSTEYCMAQVEQEFIDKAPQNEEELYKAIEELPYWAAKEHGKKFGLMYQVYTHPKYMENRKKFFEEVNEKYAEYSKSLSEKLGASSEELLGFVNLFVHTIVHYAIFGNDVDIEIQIKSLKKLLDSILKKN